MNKTEDYTEDISLIKPGDVWMAIFLHKTPDKKGRTKTYRPVYIHSVNKKEGMVDCFEITTQNVKKKRERLGDRKFFEYMHDFTEDEIETLHLEDDSCIKCADLCEIPYNFIDYRVCNYDYKNFKHNKIRRMILGLYLKAEKDKVVNRTKYKDLYKLEEQDQYREILKNIKLV